MTLTLARQRELHRARQIKRATVPFVGRDWLFVASDPVSHAQLDAIIDTVCEVYRTSRSDMLSRRQLHSVVRPRQIAIHLAIRLTKLTYTEIGRRFNRDRATVNYSNCVVGEMRKDPNFDSNMAQLEYELSEGIAA